jgi:uncharacterized protein
VTGLVPLLGLVMAVGAVGTIVPLVPGISLVWGAGLVYGLDRGFGTIGVVAFAVMTGLAVAATVAGYAVPKRRATGAGVPRATVWLGVAGGVVGFFVVPVVGLPIGGARHLRRLPFCIGDQAGSGRPQRTIRGHRCPDPAVET